MNVNSDSSQSELDSWLTKLATKGVSNAAKGISQMVGKFVTVTEPVIRIIPFHEISSILGGPETETVGIYSKIDGKISGQMMMIVPYKKSLELVDLMVGIPEGTTRELGKIEKSALAELGNLTGSYFLNAIADSTGFDTRPSPPAVIVDMIGAILDILIATSDSLSDSVLMIQATFLHPDRDTEAEFWIIPDRQTLKSFAQEA